MIILQSCGIIKQWFVFSLYVHNVTTLKTSCNQSHVFLLLFLSDVFYQHKRKKWFVRWVFAK